MRGTNPIHKSCCAATTLFVAVMLFSGCPLFDGPSKTQVTTVFTADSAPLANAVLYSLKKPGGGPVPLDEIMRLDVTISRIRVHHAGEGWILLFPGTDGETLRLNLVDLTEIGQVLTVDNLPPGMYTQLELTVEDPELVLVSSYPDPVDAEIKTTANGRLFAKMDFILEEGALGILQLDFGGIHLVRTGNGKYVLTPQLRADIHLLSAEDTVVTGELNNLNTGDDTFDVAVNGGAIRVDCSEAVIFLPGDTDVPTGAKTDLESGQQVEVEGRLFADNTMKAAAIRILSDPTPPPPVEEPFDSIGSVNGLDVTTETFTLAGGPGYLVDYSQATVTGAPLGNNALVHVIGTLVTDGSGSFVRADSVQVLF